MIGRLPAERWIIVVSGLPRSGTSMMMQMLGAGGVELLTDNLRAPDESNPRGYYEYEPVKKLAEGDDAWLEHARGRAVKVVSPLLEHLPDRYPFKVILMTRSLQEILASQRRMLSKPVATPGDADESKLADLYSLHLGRIRSWLAARRNLDALYVRYRDVLEDGEGSASRIEHFLGRPLDQRAMVSVVDESLYHQRGGGAEAPGARVGPSA